MDNSLLGPEVTFDMRSFFAHRDQQAVVAGVHFVLVCLRAVGTDHDAE